MMLITNVVVTASVVALVALAALVGGGAVAFDLARYMFIAVVVTVQLTELLG